MKKTLQTILRISRNRKIALSLGLMVLLTGCPPVDDGIELKPVLPVNRAIEIVNTNNESLATGLQASGSVSGRITDSNENTRNFNLDANLLVVPPSHLRLDLQALGETQVLFGSNDQQYWLYVKPEIDTYWYGRTDQVPGGAQQGPPLRSDMLVDSFGIQQIPLEWTFAEGSVPAVQRIDGEHQQILFLNPLSRQDPFLQKEYWLKRTDHRLIGKVLYRNRDGEIIMESMLDRFRELEGTDALIAHSIQVTWPEDKAEINFDIRHWKKQPLLSIRHRAFVPPHQRGVTYSDMINVDETVE